MPEKPPISLLLKAEKGGYQIPDGDGFRFLSFPEVRTLVAEVAGGLRARRLGAGDAIAICGETRYEWNILDQAIQWIGGVVVPIYPTLLTDQIQYILDDADCKACFCDDPEKAAAVGADSFDLETLRAEAIPCADIQMDAPMTIVYTSGTTGKPKGAILTHRNWTASNAGSIQGLLLWSVPEISLLAFLPLAHVAGYASMLALTDLEGTIAFSHPTRIATDFPQIRPNLVIAVPRIYERIQNKVEEEVAKSAVKAFLYKHGKANALRAGRAREQGTRLPFWHGFWERILYRKLRAKLGFDRVQVSLTGAAPVRPDLLYFFQGIGINIVEGYGLTECAGLLVCNQLDGFQAGTVGKPMPGSQVKLDADGEILLAGPTIFQGYHGMETDCLIEEDGATWLQTGDIGEMRNGDLAIIDRKKEIEILDTGKNVAPAHIEEQLKAHFFIEEACVIGHGRKYCTALIQPAFEAITDSVSMDAWEKMVAETNASLPSHEQIRKFHVVPEAFSVERDELTPTFKKKRRNIVKNYADEIDAMY